MQARTYSSRDRTDRGKPPTGGLPASPPTGPARSPRYLAAPGHLRRQWNQALFERLVVHDDEIEATEIAEPFATLADPELPARLGREAVTQTAASSGGGSNEGLLVVLW